MSDVIKINKCVEVVDNWGNTEQYRDADLYKLLITPENWTDDQTFISDEGSYDIDDLIGKTVMVGPYIFTVQDTMDIRYYSAPGPLGILAFQFICALFQDRDLDLTKPMVDTYLFQVGDEMQWPLSQTIEVINFLKLRKMLV